jgi:hypothetical protein
MKKKDKIFPHNKNSNEKLQRSTRRRRREKGATE